MADAIKPCPWCSGEARVVLDNVTVEDLGYFIGCDTPRCPGSRVRRYAYVYESGAIDGWNTRADGPESDGLRACPFCGGKAYAMSLEDGFYGTIRYIAGCGDPLCRANSGSGFRYYSLDDAREAWNRRAQ